MNKLTPLESSEDTDTNLNELDFTLSTCFLMFKSEILVLKRARKDEQVGKWGVPGGKLSSEETPVSALVREVFEETGLTLFDAKFQFLSKALITNPCDGRYLIYLYYYKLYSKPKISIHHEEHSDFQWVGIHNFMNLNLLVSQGLAFKHIEKKLYKLAQIEAHCR